MAAGIFLSVKDLMRLNGTDNYNSAQREHSTIRAAMHKEDKTMKRRLGRRKHTKRRLTIREYCDYMQLEFSEIWQFLRGSSSDDDEHHPA